MNISGQTISALGSIITGNSKLSPYRTGEQLVSFFNQFKFGAEDTYGNGFPSRWYYAKENLQELNNTPVMKDVIVVTFDPRNFIRTKFNIAVAVEHFN